jgi:fucose 4-O-acetylase-like acetyltransferase
MENTQVKKQSLISKAFNLPALQKSRLYWVDYLKGIAIILVVYRHSLLGIQRSGLSIPDAFVNANMIFYSFRMPLFFMLSGIFISRSLAKRTVGQFISAKFETLLYPYLIWVTIQVTLQIVMSSFTNSERTLIDYTYIFYQPRNLDQFWYLPALFNATVIFVLLKKYVNGKWWLQIALGIGFYFLSPYLQNISMLSDWMEFYIFVAMGDAISEVFFKERVQNLFKSYLTLILATPVFIFAQVYYLNHQTTQLQFLCIAFIGCFTMLCLAFIFQKLNILSFLRIYGYHSLYIYVIHVMVAALTRIFLMHVMHVNNSLVILFTCIIVASTLPVIIYNLIIRDNVLWFLFTYKRKHKKQPKPSGINIGSPVVQTS